MANVDLTIENPTPLDLTVHVVVQKKNGSARDELALGTIAADATHVEDDIGARRGDRVVVTASSDGVTLYTETFSVRRRSQEQTITIRPDGRQLPSDASSIDAIRRAFSDLGPDLGVPAFSLRSGLQAYFGALVVVKGQQPSGEARESRILYRLTPKQFMGNEVTLDEFSFPSNHETDEAEVMNASSADFQGGAPLVAQAGFSATSSALQRVRWAMSGFGVVPRPETGERTYAEAFDALGESERKQIGGLLKANPGAKVCYLNHFYVVRHAMFETTAAKKITTNANVSSVVLTASGAYSYEGAETQRRVFDSVVVGAFGPELVLTDQLDAVTTAEVDSALGFGTVLF